MRPIRFASLHLPFVMVLGVFAGASGLWGQTYYEKWHVTSAGLAISQDDPAHGFKDKWPGADLLPYTADDESLPEGGNPGGTWTTSTVDSDGDGDADWRWVCARRGDDDMQTYAANSEFQYGVFAEGEDWQDYLNADLAGPCKHPIPLPDCGDVDNPDPGVNCVNECDGTNGDPGVECYVICDGTNGTPGVDCVEDCHVGDDFEHNDGMTSWEDINNYYWYNNVKANQRGFGGSKYYFEWKDATVNPGAFDEVQRWRKGVQLRTNYTGGSERPEKNFARSHQGMIKGLFIPVDKIAGLKDGELDPLFGWGTVDMAKYVRDVLGPRLEDAALTVYEDSVNCASAALPPTYLIIEQGAFDISVRNSDNAKKSASWFGITPTTDLPDADGHLASNAKYRWCSIYTLWEDPEPDPVVSKSPRIDLVPDDGVLKNLWARDNFLRKENDGSGIQQVLGYLELGCERVPGAEGGAPDNCWYFTFDNPDPTEGGCANDLALTLPTGSGPDNSWVRLPITGVPSLDATKGKIYAEIDLNVFDSTATQNRTQVVLARNGAPVAWAEITNKSKAIVGVGGAGLSPVTGGASTLGTVDVEVASTDFVFTRFALVLDGAGRKLELLREGVSVASLSFAAGAAGDLSVDSMVVWSESGAAGGDNRITLDQIGILQGFSDGNSFVRGDCNGDGGTTGVLDALTMLTIRFLGGFVAPCAAACDINADGEANEIADAIGLLSANFLGTVTIPAPYPNCGPFATEGDRSLGCETASPTCR